MKSRLINEMRRHDLSHATSETAVDQVFASLVNALERYGLVTIPGFGTFRRHFVDTRTVRNPRTGATSTQQAHHVVKFKAAKGGKM